MRLNFYLTKDLHVHVFVPNVKYWTRVKLFSREDSVIRLFQLGPLAIAFVSHLFAKDN